MKKKIVIAILLLISIGLFTWAGSLWMNKSKDTEKNDSKNEIVLDTDNNLKEDNTAQEKEEDSLKEEADKETSSDDVKNETVPDDSNKNNMEKEPDKKEEQGNSEKPVETEKPKECQHSYDKNIEQSSCTKDGLITYTCTKCSHSYTEVIKAAHEYGKYLCEYCGKIDPQASPCWAMSFWLHRFGEMNGAGTIYGYPNCESALNVYCLLNLDSIYLSYIDDSTGEHFKVSFHTTDSCFVSYSLGGTRGSFTTSNAALSSSMKITFEDFSTSEDNPVDEAEFAEIFASKIDYYMQRIQHEIMPNTGVGLRFFGFNY